MLLGAAWQAEPGAVARSPRAHGAQASPAQLGIELMAQGDNELQVPSGGLQNMPVTSHQAGTLGAIVLRHGCMRLRRGLLVWRVVHAMPGYTNKEAQVRQHAATTMPTMGTVAMP